jgi:carbamoyl-phosphate synthase large subunit
MGIDATFGLAFAKSQTAAGTTLPGGGTVFLSLADRDKPAGLVVARRFRELDWRIVATSGTAAYLARFGVDVDAPVAKLSDHAGESAVDLIASNRIDLVVNTPRGSGPRSDGSHIRMAANLHKVSCLTTVEAALAAAHGMAERAVNEPRVRSLQEYHEASLG